MPRRRRYEPLNKHSRPSSRPFSQAGLRLDTGRISSPSRADRPDVTTSIIREYGVRRNPVEIIFSLSDGPRHSMNIINLCNVPSVPRFPQVPIRFR